MHTWFLIYCKPGQDDRAELNLLRQGFEVFRPTVEVVKSRVGGQSVLKRESLFPRYVFLRADPGVRSLAPVLSTFGVACFVRFGNQYATCSGTLIDKIQANAMTQIASLTDAESLKNGDEIYVDGHGFDHVKAIYCSPCGDKRAMILMNILGNESRLDVPKECISKKVG